MKLLLKTEYLQLLANGKPENRLKDHKPVVKLFVPGLCTILLTYIDPQNPQLAYGLCDWGLGYVEYWVIDANLLSKTKNRFGETVQRDNHFISLYPISVYEDAARYCRQIVDNPYVLYEYAPWI